MASVRERPRLDLDYDVEAPSGRHYHWSDQDPKPENVPTPPTLSSTMPGGHDQFDTVLPRKPGTDYPDLDRFSTVTALGPGGDIAWEGRLERTPETSGDRMSVSPGCVGWQAALDDNKSVSEIYIDRDLSRWGPSSRGLRQLLLTVGFGSIHDPTVRPDITNGLPSLVTGWTGAWNAKPYAGALYDAGAGVEIGAIYYDFVEDGGLTPADPGWEMYLYVRPTDTISGSGGVTGNLRAASGTGYFTPSPAARFAAIEHYYNVAGAAGVDQTDYTVSWRNFAVYGDHGLTLQGGDPGGLYASDVVAHAVGKWCPALNYTTGPDGTVRPSSLVIDHLTFNERTTASEIVKGATRFELQDWAVWDNKTFWWHDRGAVGRSWRARVGPSGLEGTGQDANRVWNSIIVEYQDVDGTTRTVGPPGSGMDTESAYLEDLDPENPANQLGITRRDKLTMGVTTPAGAIEVGRRFLEQAKLLDTSGKATLAGHVQDDRGVWHPAWRVRAGDAVSFTDAQDVSERRIVKASYSHASRACTVDLDAPAEGLQALLERLQVALVKLGL